MELIEEVARTIQLRRLLPSGERVLLAVSGGLDSMVLLEVMHRLAGRGAWQLMVGHFNHQLRGGESDADEGLVRAQAEALRLDYRAGSGNVRELAGREGISVEMAARQARHRFLAEVAEAEGIRRVMLAHHANDQVETFWVQLLRGNVGEGLGGMRWVSRSPANREVLLVRPLLEVRRQVLEDYAAEQKVAFREDASNQQSDFFRNRIRLELLPLLERDYQPAVRETTERLMEVLRGEKEWLNLQAAQWLRVSQPPFAELHRALQREVLRAQLLQKEVRPDFELIERLRMRPDEPVTVRPGWQVSCGRDGRVILEQESERGFQGGAMDLELGGGGVASWAGRKFEWQVQSKAKIAASAGREVFDADRVGAKVRLRHWQPADRFQPIGMAGPVKLQDLFTNAKIPGENRRQLVVAENEQGELFWVEGLRIGEVARVREETTRRLVWQWRAG